jgi:hypothetical protein
METKINFLSRNSEETPNTIAHNAWETMHYTQKKNKDDKITRVEEDYRANNGCALVVR